MSCGRCKRTPKRRPYGYKGTTYCVCDTNEVEVVSKKAERNKAKREISKERKRIGK
jgi:uncharacterized Zn finger protein (UPF0148 family)